MEQIAFKFKKLSSLAVVPRYAKSGDAGMDIVAISREETDKYIEYGTGLAFELPPGYVMLVFPRSSISQTDLSLANAVAVLDSGYRGELKLRFRRTGQAEYQMGDRIAQILILPLPQIRLIEADALSESERGEGGFGSSGKN